MKKKLFFEEKERVIPEDVATLIQRWIDGHKEKNKKKESEEKNKRKDKELREARLAKMYLEKAIENLLFLNALVQAEPLKSYLKLNPTGRFFLEEGHIHFYLRNDGVYRKDNDILKRVSYLSLVKDAYPYPPHGYICSLARWNKVKIIAYLHKTFSPIII